MSFDGPALSFDDEGSILFDGEKIIVTVPVGHEALDHLGSEKEIPFPVVYTHHSHHQDQQASTPPGGNRPSQPTHDHGNRPGSQASGQGSSSKSDEQGSKGASQAEDSTDTDRGKDETVAQDELPDFEEAKENRIDPADIKFYLAARHNPVLNEIQLMHQQENIPLVWRSPPKRLLRLCADYGIDEENDAEARDYLEQIKNGGSYEKRKDDPVNAAWVKAHEAYDPALGDKNNDKQAIVDYRTQIEATYGVTFSSIKGAGDWDLLRVRMVHVGMEMAAAALGDMARTLGYQWDNATAFRRIIGEIDLILSGVKHPNDAPAEVVGRQITFYWLEERDRLAYPIPNLVLHELGHVFNTNAGMGNRDRIGSINATDRHPITLAGMGAPDPNRLLTEDKDTLYLYDKSWENLVPPLYDFLGLDDGHKLFHDMKYKDQIQLMRQSWEGTKNEITADAFLNWVYHRNTKGASGFTGDEKGQKWQRFMNENMDVWIRNAITYEILRRGEPISPTEAEKDLMPFPVPVGRGVTKGSEGPNVRTGPSTSSGIHSTLLLGREVIILGRDHADEDPDNNWVAVLYDGDVHWIWQHGVQLPDGVLWTDLTPLDQKRRKLTYDFSTSTQEDDSWFPILLSAAYGE